MKNVVVIIFIFFATKTWSLEVDHLDVGDSYYIQLNQSDAFEKVSILRINKKDKSVKVRLPDGTADWLFVKDLLSRNKMREIQEKFAIERKNNRKYCCCISNYKTQIGIEWGPYGEWVSSRQCKNGWESRGFYKKDKRFWEPGRCVSYNSELPERKSCSE